MVMARGFARAIQSPISIPPAASYNGRRPGVPLGGFARGTARPTERLDHRSEMERPFSPVPRAHHAHPPRRHHRTRPTSPDGPRPQAPGRRRRLQGDQERHHRGCLRPLREGRVASEAGLWRHSPRECRAARPRAAGRRAGRGQAAAQDGPLRRRRSGAAAISPPTKSSEPSRSAPAESCRVLRADPACPI